MVRYAPIEIPLGGVDQWSDAPYVLKGQKLDTVENLRMRAPPKLSARYPMTAYGTSTLDSSTIGTCYNILGHKKETLLCNATTLYAQDSASGNWANKGRLSEAHVSRFPVHSEFTGASPADAAAAFNQNIIVVAWKGQGGALGAVVVDALTDTIVATYSPTDSFGAATRFFNPKVVAVGNYIYILANPDAGAGISYARINVTSGNYTFGNLANLPVTGSASSAVSIEACAWSSTQFLVAYYDSAAGRVYVDRIETTGNTVDATRNDVKTTCTAIGLCQASSTLGFVAFSGNGGVGAGLYVASFGANLVTTGGPTLLAGNVRAVGLAASSSTRGLAVYEFDATATERASSRWVDFSSTAVAGTTRLWSDVVPVSVPFTYGTSTYCLFINNSDVTRSSLNARNESTYYLAQVGSSTATVAGRLMGYACRSLAKPSIAQGYLHSWAVNGTKYDIGLGLLTKFKFAKDDDDDKLLARNALVRTRFDFDPSNLHSSAEWAHGLFFAGACPRWYDGQNTSEHGFPWGPEWAAASVAVVGGGTLEVGVYQVASTYEHEDALGYVVRSLPSPYYEKTTTAGNQVIQVTHDHECDLSAKPASSGVSQIRVRHWKTLKNATEPLYNAQASELGEAITIGTVATLDQTDANAPSGEVLYITGDILDNGPTPPCKVAVRHGDRIFLAGLEDAELVAFSQPFVAGEQPRFNEALTLRLPEPIHALASMDQTLVAFGRTGVYLVSGEGPPATGGIEVGFSVTTVSRVVGTDQPRSVVVTPKGVMFLSARGFYLLDRGFGLTWAGAAIIDSTTTYNVCAGSAVDPTHPEVVFWLRNSGTSGVRAVYNFELDQWLMDTLPANTRGFGGAVVWNETISAWTLAQCMSDGYAYYESQAYPPVEGSDYIDTQVVTGWIPLNTIQGWQRVRKLSLLLDIASALTSGVTLTIQVGYDYDDAWFETHSFTGTELAALGAKAYALMTTTTGANLVDGETFVLWNGTANTTFEFDNNAAVTPGNVAVDFTALDTAKVVRDTVVSAVNAASIGIEASQFANNKVLLVNETAGAAGNGANSETVANAAFVLDHFSFGVDADQVEVETTRQECQAIRFRIRVIGTSDDAGNIDFRSLVIDAGLAGSRTAQLNHDNARD